MEEENPESTFPDPNKNRRDDVIFHTLFRLKNLNSGFTFQWLGTVFRAPTGILSWNHISAQEIRKLLFGAPSEVHPELQIYFAWGGFLSSLSSSIKNKPPVILFGPW